MAAFAIAGSLALSVAASDLGSLLRTGHDDHSGFGGDKMERTFTSYKSLPLGEKELALKGWHRHDNKGCDPNLGFVWTEDPSGPTKSNPLKLYTTSGGQPAGVGIVILGYGYDPLPQAQQKWVTAKPLVDFHPLSTSHAHIDVAFRSGDIMCDGLYSESEIGDTLIVNPGGDSKYVLPLAEQDAEAAGWRRGSCFDGMGWHWFLDTSVGQGELSWKAENLFPIVTMYGDARQVFDNSINAMFFASTVDQVSIPVIQSNEWEPKALSNLEMCKNTCDSDCTFSGTHSLLSAWSTLHVYFRDHSSVTCPRALTCGIPWPFRGNCCEARSDISV